MIPLQVTVKLSGAISLPNRPIAIDGLLAWAVTQRDGIDPALRVQDLVPIEIPVQREPGGRFHLASCSIFEVELREKQWTNRRFPMEHAQNMVSRNTRSILTSGGPSKSFRIPREALHLVNDTMTWYLIGDLQEVQKLLGFVSHLGHKRSVGLGAVESWDVQQCETWEGFPIVRNGKPLRPLPTDWPGLVGPETGYACLTYPYWLAEKEQICAVP